jgi:hypothetical protein
VSAMDLHVFGVALRLEVDARDLTDASFFYDHLRAPATTDPLITVTLATERGGGFFSSLLAKDLGTKTVDIDEPGSSTSYRFTSWSEAPSAVPPFATRWFGESGIGVVPGAVVESPSGLRSAILGSIYAGKTTLVLRLLHACYRLVSDQLVVIAADGASLPYLAPIGIRRATLAAFEESGVLEGIDTRQTISEATGRVVLFRPGDLSWIRSTGPGTIDRIVFLASQDERSTPRRVEVESARLVRVFPGARREAVLAHLPATGTVTVGPMEWVLTECFDVDAGMAFGEPGPAMGVRS